MDMAKLWETPNQNTTKQVCITKRRNGAGLLKQNGKDIGQLWKMLDKYQGDRPYKEAIEEVKQKQHKAFIFFELYTRSTPKWHKKETGSFPFDFVKVFCFLN